MPAMSQFLTSLRISSITCRPSSLSSDSQRHEYIYFRYRGADADTVTIDTGPPPPVDFEEFFAEVVRHQ